MQSKILGNELYFPHPRCALRCWLFENVTCPNLAAL